VPTALLANVRLAGDTVTGEERVPPRLTVRELSVEGANLVCPNADEPGIRRESKMIVAPKNSFVPYSVGLEL
jgi:hypothetical protein